MFDLEANINAWCDYLRASGKLAETDIVELENHLRDQIEELVTDGLSQEEAFLIGVKRLGNVNLISAEYSKVNTEQFWKQLLTDSVVSNAAKNKGRNVMLVVIFSLLAGTIAKLPNWFGVDMFTPAYFKNLSLFVLPWIILFFVLTRNRMTKQQLWLICGIFVLTALIVNIFPSYEPHHTEILTVIHLPIMLWLITGVAYAGKDWLLSKERMNFIRFTGECVIYGSLIMFGLIVLFVFASTIFQSIAINIDPFMFNYGFVYGGCAAAMITVYLVENKKSIVENFAPVLAKIFSPVLILVLITFLVVSFVTRNSPYMDRNLLIGFDLMLVLVLGIVLYTISARNLYDPPNIFDYLNAALIVAAILVDGVALSAILQRLTEFGISPNKLAAFGENILLLINLAALLWLYIRYFTGKITFSAIEKWQTSYLTVYAIWMAVVVFIFPVAFRFI